jgi:hypothetical protein
MLQSNTHRSRGPNDTFAVSEKQRRRPIVSESFKASSAASSERNTHPSRICVCGAGGALGGNKLKASLDTAADNGVTLYATDILAESDFKPEFTGYQAYFNLTRRQDREKLASLASVEKLDFGYDATWAPSRLMNIANLGPLFQHYFITKSFVSVRHYHAFEDFMSNKAYEYLREMLQGHDHFASKPGLTALVASLPAAHKHYGKFSRMQIVITERRTVNHDAEQNRRKALLEGMVPDLASHAIMLIQLLTPVGLMWVDVEGNFFKRLNRVIRPSTCIRAQMKLAALPQDVDTACIIEYVVTETLSLAREDGTPVRDPFENSFSVLVICGKGLSAAEGINRDLKAIELSFQGQGKATGVIDLETNILNEVLKEVPGIRIPTEEERKHRGINLPLMNVLTRWDDFRQNAAVRARLFQDKNLIWENMSVLAATTSVSRPGILPCYSSREAIHNFANAHISSSNGFSYFGSSGSGWPMKEPALHLMLGQAVPCSIP